jgi:hypothetical protein
MMKKLWHMDQIKELDFPSPTGFMKVKDFLPQVLEEVRADYSTQYAILKKSMRENGQLVPLLVSRDLGRLRDGVHRVALGTELGWNYMEVSTEKKDNPWDLTEDGQKYWRLWNWRLNGFR